MVDSTAIEKTIQQFERFEQAIIDTSSIIYLNKLLLLDHLSRIIQIFIIPGVKEEYGALPNGIEVLEQVPQSDSVDQSIIVCWKFFFE